MGLFSGTVRCAVCGNPTDRSCYRIRQSRAWCCSECFSNAVEAAGGMLDVSAVTVTRLKQLTDPAYTGTAPCDRPAAGRPRRWPFPKK